MIEAAREPHPRRVPPLKRLRRVVALTVAFTSAALALTSALDWVRPVAGGLKGEYFYVPGASAPARVSSQRLPSTDDLLSAWRSVPDRFTAVWSGLIAVLRDTSYTIAVTCAEPCGVYLDGRPLVGVAANAESPRAMASTRLERGVHALHIRYAHDGKPVQMAIEWGREGGRLAPLPSWALFDHRANGWEVVATVALAFAVVGTQWIWVSALCVAMLVVLLAIADSVRRWLEREGLWSWLKWILLGSLVLNATAVWWGLPAIWVPDELTPGTVMDALSQHFSHGWYDRWPPLHYYILTVAMGPMIVLDAFGRIDMFSGIWPVMLTLTTRFVSLAASLGIVIAVCVTGSRVFGRRAGLFAAMIFSLTAPFVYYSKTANLDVPYVFWFALSLVPYIRIVTGARARDFILFGVFATLAICTKDQAYALYVVPALVVAFCVMRDARARGLPAWRGFVEPRLLAGVLVAIVLFALCHNLLFNFGGFVTHVRYIAGPGNENYRAFPPTAAGRLALLWLTGHLIKISWGWPLTVVTVAGIVLAFGEQRFRLIAIVLLAPVISYYLAFINVILYNYDRFVLPICLILAIFGGLLVDAALRWTSRSPRWSVGLLVAVFTYTLLYSSTLDALMLRDSRHVAERWMRAHVSGGQLVGVSGPSELLPRLDCGCADIATLPALRGARPT